LKLYANNFKYLGIFMINHDVTFRRNIEGKRIIRILVHHACEKSSCARPRSQSETVAIKSLLSVLVWSALPLPIHFSFKYHDLLYAFLIEILSLNCLNYLLDYLFQWSKNLYIVQLLKKCINIICIMLRINYINHV